MRSRNRHIETLKIIKVRFCPVIFLSTCQYIVLGSKILLKIRNTPVPVERMLIEVYGWCQRRCVIRKFLIKRYNLLFIHSFVKNSGPTTTIVMSPPPPRLVVNDSYFIYRPVHG